MYSFSVVLYSTSLDNFKWLAPWTPLTKDLVNLCELFTIYRIFKFFIILLSLNTKWNGLFSTWKYSMWKLVLWIIHCKWILNAFNENIQVLNYMLIESNKFNECEKDLKIYVKNVIFKTWFIEGFHH